MTAAAPNAVDWSATRARLDALGAVCFQVQRTAEGETSFQIWLPTSEPGRTRRIESRAATEAEAVRLALAQAGAAR